MYNVINAFSISGKLNIIDDDHSIYQTENYNYKMAYLEIHPKCIFYKYVNWYPSLQLRNLKIKQNSDWRHIKHLNVNLL